MLMKPSVMGVGGRARTEGGAHSHVGGPGCASSRGWKALKKVEPEFNYSVELRLGLAASGLERFGDASSRPRLAGPGTAVEQHITRVVRE